MKRGRKERDKERGQLPCIYLKWHLVHVWCNSLYSRNFCEAEFFCDFHDQTLPCKNPRENFFPPMSCDD